MFKNYWTLLIIFEIAVKTMMYCTCFKEAKIKNMLLTIEDKEQLELSYIVHI